MNEISIGARMCVGPNVCGVREEPWEGCGIGRGKFQSNILESFASFSFQEEKEGVAQLTEIEKRINPLLRATKITFSSGKFQNAKTKSQINSKNQNQKFK